MISELQLTSCVVDLRHQRVVWPDETIPLTTKEAQLLAFLAERAGRNVTREELLVEVWGYGENVVSRAVDHAVKRLRPKIEDNSSRPEHLLTVHGIGYRLELPDAVSTSVRTEPALPAPTSHDRELLGRAGELEAIEGHFREGIRVLTLSGAAGTGKSRLAQAHARHAGSQGVSIVWVDLVDTDSADQVYKAVADALLLDELDPNNPGQQLNAALAAQCPALLVLDNAERAVEGAAGLAASWTETVPGLQILVTSRERLRITPEVVLEVGPLPADDALQLFIERVRRVRAGYDPGEADRAILRKVVERLDGLPLAVELAAARAGLLSAQALLDRLDDRFRILRSARRDVPKRQATLWGAIDWTWELLDPTQQSALAQCGVFRGGFSLDAAEAVIALDDPDALVIDTLQHLHDKSLMRLDANRGRFAMYESVRAYAEQRLDQLGQTEATHGRHGAYYEQLLTQAADRAYGPEEQQALTTLDTETDNGLAVHDNLAASDPARAARSLLAVAYSLTQSGQLSLLEDRLTRSLATDLEPELRARLLVRRASNVHRYRNDRAGQDDLKAALSLCDAHGLVEVEALARQALGNLHYQYGRAAEAIEAWEATQRLAEQAKMEWLVAQSFGLLGAAKHEVGAIDEAVALHERGIEAARKLGSQRLLHIELGNLAACLAASDPEQAIESLTEALSGHKQLGNARLEANVRANLGYLYLATGDIEQARAHLEESAALAQLVGDQRIESIALTNLASCLLRGASLDVAGPALRQAVETARLAGNKRFWSFALANLAVYHQLLHQDELALRELQRADEVARDAGGDPAHQATMRPFRVMSLARLGRLAEARSELSKIDDDAGEQGMLHGIAEAMVLAAEGEAGGASERAAAVRQAADSHGVASLAWRVWESAGAEG